MKQAIDSVPITEQKLTVIIPFLNEGEEVVNTVNSIRQFAGQHVDIITINDGSDDGYAYADKLKPFNVTYIVNKVRLGAGASRDVGITRCHTPYFLLIDAHMRFYESQWINTICQLLDSDERCLLCCRTKPLQRNHNGSVIESGEINTFGAFQPLNKSDYLPDIKWNNHEIDPNSDIEPIPCVLGACYAASKRYWNYIRGLEGLIHYGSEEAYISYKVWMEGGRCLLLKRHVIGHIYRKLAPYVMIHDKIVYNYLFISEMVFPRRLRNWSHSIAYTKNGNTYRGAMAILNQKAAQIDKLKKYYSTIFTRSFQEVQDMHRRCMSSEAEAKLKSFDSFSVSVMEWHRQNPPSHPGIADGSAARVIWLFNFAKALSQAPDQSTFTMLDEIREAIETDRVPWNFANGLCGLGWMYIYLYVNGFIHSLPSTVLHRIDNALTLIQIDRLPCGTDDFMTGAGGLLCYATSRLAQLQKSGQTSPLNSSEMRSALQQLATRATTDTANLYTHFNALQFLDLINGEFDHDYAPSLHDWTNLPDDLPTNSRFWNGSMTSGCIGYSQLLTSIKITYQILDK